MTWPNRTANRKYLRGPFGHSYFGTEFVLKLTCSAMETFPNRVRHHLFHCQPIQWPGVSHSHSSIPLSVNIFPIYIIDTRSSWATGTFHFKSIPISGKSKEAAGAAGWLVVVMGELSAACPESHPKNKSKCKTINTNYERYAKSGKCNRTEQ